MRRRVFGSSKAAAAAAAAEGAISAGCVAAVVVASTEPAASDVLAFAAVAVSVPPASVAAGPGLCEASSSSAAGPSAAGPSPAGPSPAGPDLRPRGWLNLCRKACRLGYGTTMGWAGVGVGCLEVAAASYAHTATRGGSSVCVCSGRRLVGASPSMVDTFLPSFGKRPRGGRRPVGPGRRTVLYRGARRIPWSLLRRGIRART
jgi:hypothetical protein